MRGFALIQHSLSTVALLVGALIWGVAITPGVLLWLHFETTITAQPLLLRALCTGIILSLGYTLWGLCTMYLIGMIGVISRPRLPEARAPLQSTLTIRWALLAVLHRFAIPFLRHIVPSWMGNLYYRMLGLSMGAGCQINTEHVNDCFMIRLGKGVVIGGHATLNGHIVEKGELVLAPTTIGDGALIGGGSIVQPGCKIGAGAVVASRAVLPKWTEVPAGEVWGGVPARCIRLADGSKPGKKDAD